MDLNEFGLWWDGTRTRRTTYDIGASPLIAGKLSQQDCGNRASIFVPATLALSRTVPAE